MMFGQMYNLGHRRWDPPHTFYLIIIIQQQFYILCQIKSFLCIYYVNKKQNLIVT